MPSRAIYALLLFVLVTSVPAPADILFTDSTLDPAMPTPASAVGSVGAYVGFLNNTSAYITANDDNLNFDIVPDMPQSPVSESSSGVLLSIFVVGLALRGLGPALRWKLKRR